MDQSCRFASAGTPLHDGSGSPHAKAHARIEGDLKFAAAESTTEVGCCRIRLV
jgi:hypothetical protein